MKPIILFAFAALLGGVVSAQTKVDSVQLEKVPLLSYEQYQRAIQTIVADVPARYADDIRQKFTVLFQQLATAYQEQRKQPAPKK